MAKSIEDYTLEEAWQKIETALNEDSKPIEGVKAVYQFDISGDGGGTYQLHLSDSKAKVEQGSPSKPDCTLQMAVPQFKDMLLGKLNGTAAFMSGKLKVKGNIALAMKIESILRQYDVKQHI